MISTITSMGFFISSKTILLLLLATILPGLLSCDFTISRDGSPGFSESIAAARRHGVYRATYKLAESGTTLLPEDIEEAWLETPWSYKGVFGGIHFDSIANQNRNVMVINLSEKGEIKIKNNRINVRLDDVGFTSDWNHKHLVSSAAVPMHDTILLDVVTYRNDTPISVSKALFIRK